MIADLTTKITINIWNIFIKTIVLKKYIVEVGFSRREVFYYGGMFSDFFLVWIKFDYIGIILEKYLIEIRYDEEFLCVGILNLWDFELKIVYL